MVIPKHIGLIMDGNGRWARQRGLSRSEGHKAGFEHIPKVLEACHELGIPIVSAYAWSTENWNRPKAEVDYIMHSLEKHLPEFVNELHQRGVRFMHSGRRDELPPKVLQALDEAAALTRHNGSEVFNFAFNYGGRAELVDATRKLMNEGVELEQISESTINAHLWTSGLPNVDLVIRTSGEQRLSNFLLWQCAYACVYVTQAYWPDVSRDDIEAAVKYYDEIMVKV
jgi:undecaprenyl diphosphate synthase